MIWVDREVKEIIRRKRKLEWVDDMKTPSVSFDTLASCGVSFVSFSQEMRHCQNGQLWDKLVPDPYGSQFVVLTIQSAYEIERV